MIPGRSEARNVGRIDDLEMLDPPAPVVAVLLRQRLVDGDDLRIGGIADRVGRDLEARRGRRFGEFSISASEWNCSPRVSGLSA